MKMQTSAGQLRFENTIIDGDHCKDWLDRCLVELKSLDNVRMISRATVFGIYDQDFGVLEHILTTFKILKMMLF